LSLTAPIHTAGASFRCRAARRILSSCRTSMKWVLFGFGAWAIELRSTCAYVGQTALNCPVRGPGRELGWVLFGGLKAGAMRRKRLS
jgi:hypothetical protein